MMFLKNCQDVFLAFTWTCKLLRYICGMRKLVLVDASYVADIHAGVHNLEKIVYSNCNFQSHIDAVPKIAIDINCIDCYLFEGNCCIDISLCIERLYLSLAGGL